MAIGRFRSPRAPKYLLFGSMVSMLAGATGTALAESESAGGSPALEEILIWGTSVGQRSDVTRPASVLTQADLVSINVATTEDLVKYEPSLVIRRRFIGDANGTMGMRGSNMFQTSRSMVFADGVPLHYLLQSRWNGSPRWTMVSASEIARVEVLYGPFSAEYSGNAMGGVVLIESAIPQQREIHFDSSVFRQEFNAYGFDDTLTGYKSFFSFGDRINDLSLYFSVNRLENDSQPQTFYHGSPGGGADARTITGGIVGNDQLGHSQLWLGDSGVITTRTNNYKFKAGYDFSDWSALLNVAYEDRYGINDPNSYMRAQDHSTVWGGVMDQNGNVVSMPASRFSVSEGQRNSLSTGLRLRGPVGDSADLEINLNRFDILRDNNRSSQHHPADPAYTGSGQITDYDNSGWHSAEAKLAFPVPGLDSVSVRTGLRYDAYEMNIDVFASDNYRAGEKTTATSSSGGKAELSGAFVQTEWLPTEHWEFQLGGRLEHFRSRAGYYSTNGNGLTLVPVPGQSRSSFSPKFSSAWQATENWTLSYAAARAYRYPIVEELFSQYQAFNAINEANPELKPENGLHHNLGFEYALDGGYMRINVFQESIRDVIESQAYTLPGGMSVRTFVPIDQVDTLGTEFIVNINGLGSDRLDVRFNITYTNSEIVKNRVDPGIVGNQFPRMPRWRGNLLTSYRISEQWDIGLNHQYADSSFGRNDNRDTQNRVYGAQDGYSRLGARTNYRFHNGFTLSAGVDNISNDVDFVAHPWPGRTMYLSVAYDWK